MTVDPTIAAAVVSVLGALGGVALGQWLTTKNAAAVRRETRRHSQRSTMVDLVLNVREWVSIRESAYPAMRNAHTEDWLAYLATDSGRRMAENNSAVSRSLTLAAFELGEPVAAELVAELRRLVEITPEVAVAPLLTRAPKRVETALEHVHRVRGCVAELENRVAPLVRVPLEG